MSDRCERGHLPRSSEVFMELPAESTSLAPVPGERIGGRVSVSTSGTARAGSHRLAPPERRSSASAAVVPPWHLRRSRSGSRSRCEEPRRVGTVQLVQVLPIGLQRISLRFWWFGLLVALLPALQFGHDVIVSRFRFCGALFQITPFLVSRYRIRPNAAVFVLIAL
jgi:hypothetical protein